MENIPGLKLITHNTRGINQPDDPSYPFRLDATFRPPEFMEMAFVGLYGGQEVLCVLSKTEEALENFIKINKFKTHSKFISLTIEKR